MPGKKLLIYVASLMVLVGTVSAFAAIGLSDPYYSLPPIPITVLAFCTATILFVSALSPLKSRVWLYIGTCVIVLFTCSSFAVVAQDYTVREQNGPAGGLQPIGDIYIDDTHVDQEAVLIGIKAVVYNYTDSQITIDKVVLDVYYQGSEGTEWHYAGHDQWMPAVSVESRKCAVPKTTVSIEDREAIAKIYERAVIKGWGLRLKINGSIWLDTKGGAVELPFEGGGSYAWYPPP